MQDLYYLRKATIEDAVTIANIMKEVYDLLPDKSIFICDDLEFVEEVINKSGVATVACLKDNNKIVASFLAHVPGRKPNNLGNDIGLPANELDFVAHMDSSVVLPEHRGHKLEKRMIQFTEELLDKDKFKYLMSTASPNNPASCKSLENCGYECQLVKEKYGGVLRRVYLKRI